MVERSRAPLASSRPSLHHARNLGVGGVRFYAEACGSAGPAGRSEHCRRVLAWYDREKRRRLPWRTERGERRLILTSVWLSEIMLQQTTVKAVLPRYALFLRRWPDVASHWHEAELGEVLAAWAGLGYYARARNLHACARVVAEQHGGKFPEDESRTSQIARHRRLHCGRPRGDRIRQARDPCRRQYRTRRCKTVSRSPRLCRRQRARSGLSPETLTPSRRDAGDFAQGDDGSSAPPSARRAVRLAVSVRCVPTAEGYAEGVSPRRCPIARRRASGRSGAARPSLAISVRRRRSTPRAAAAWTVGRHAGNAVIALGGVPAEPSEDSARQSRAA